MDDNYKRLCAEFFTSHRELPPIPEVWNVLGEWLSDHKLVFSADNLETALRVCRPKIEQALDKLPANDYRERVVEPEFKRRKSAEPPPRESERPFGVRSWSEWIHSR